MKRTKHIFSVLLIIALALMLFACGGNDVCTAHVDKDADGKCDVCGANVEGGDQGGGNESEIALIKDGKVNFQFVHASGVGGGVMMAINTLKMNIESAGGTLDIVTDKADTVKDVEVLIGDVTTRGEQYAFDKYSLGMKGYVIKMVDNKIIINAGSADTLVDAVETFIEKILGIKGTVSSLKDAEMTANDEILEVQDNYRITSVNVNGEEIKGYTIACDFGSIKHQTAASSLNKFLYENAGYYLPIVKLEDAGKSIIIETVADAGEDGFLVKTDGNGALRIQCAYDNKFEEAFNTFYSNEFRLKTGDISFDSSYRYTYEASVVYYDDFLHLSEDGNDYPAIKAAHDFANECGQTVKATRGKTYTIGRLGVTNENDKFVFTGTIVIKTNVDWSTANIIIDDTTLTSGSEQNNAVIFRIASDYEEIPLIHSEVKEMFPAGIDAESTTKISWKYDFPALVIVTNSEHKNYVRYGGDANNGASQQELIIVDENGNIAEEARFLLDYEKVTGVSIHRTDVKPITIKGGNITTKASRLLCKKYDDGSFQHVYLQRGIQVTRSNTTLDGVKHYITNEVEAGPKDPEVKGFSYYGFFTARNASNVFFKNCLLTAHRYYSICGTYDFTATMTNNIYLENCKQTNFYRTDENGNQVSSMKDNWYWGVGGTNYCKNMVYDGCELTRYDAHSGVHHGKIINSKVTAMTLIGGGDMLIENCDIEPTGDSIVTLRQDYGSTWNGTITIKNCRVVNLNSKMYVVTMPWVNHDFGYTCHMPNLIIDGITFKNNVKEVGIIRGACGASYSTVLTEPRMNRDVLSDGKTKNDNVVKAPSFITLLNANGNRYTIFDVSFFNDTVISKNIEKIS